jgi:hypothetical protein
MRGWALHRHTAVWGRLKIKTVTYERRRIDVSGSSKQAAFRLDQRKAGRNCIPPARRLPVPGHRRRYFSARRPVVGQRRSDSVPPGRRSLVRRKRRPAQYRQYPKAIGYELLRLRHAGWPPTERIFRDVGLSPRPRNRVSRRSQDLQRRNLRGDRPRHQSESPGRVMPSQRIIAVCFMVAFIYSGDCAQRVAVDREQDLQNRAAAARWRWLSTVGIITAVHFL